MTSAPKTLTVTSSENLGKHMIVVSISGWGKGMGEKMNRQGGGKDSWLNESDRMRRYRKKIRKVIRRAQSNS